GAPAEMRKDDQNDNCRHSFPNGVGRLHEAQGSSAMFGAPRLGDERGAAAPFAPHAQTEQKAKGRELRYGMGKTTSRAGNGINEDGTHQSARAAKAIRKNTEKEAANRGSDQREGIKKASGGFAHAELGHQIGEDERVQHDVHGV